MPVNGKRQFFCQECGMGPDAHSIRTHTIRIYNVTTRRWSIHKQHGFKIGEE